MKKTLKMIAIVLAIILVMGGCLAGGTEEQGENSSVTQTNDVNKTEDKKEDVKQQTQKENKSEETNNTPEKTEPSNNKTQTSTTEQKNPTTTSQPSSTGATNKPSTSGGSSSSSASVTVPKQEDTVGNLVWVPVNGGTKYHKTSGCSNMKNPMQVTVEHAKSNGYTACKKCY